MSTEHKTIDAWVIKYCLISGVIPKVKAWELGPTGRIKVCEGEMRNLEFDRGEWESMEWLARKKAREMQAAAIAKREKDLEGLRKLSFEGDAGPECEATA